MELPLCVFERRRRNYCKKLYFEGTGYAVPSEIRCGQQRRHFVHASVYAECFGSLYGVFHGKESLCRNRRPEQFLCVQDTGIQQHAVPGMSGTRSERGDGEAHSHTDNETHGYADHKADKYAHGYADHKADKYAHGYADYKADKYADGKTDHKTDGDA